MIYNGKNCKGGEFISKLILLFFISYFIYFFITLYSIYTIIEITFFHKKQGSKLNLKKNSLKS